MRTTHEMKRKRSIPWVALGLLAAILLTIKYHDDTAMYHCWRDPALLMMALWAVKMRYLTKMTALHFFGCLVIFLTIMAGIGFCLGIIIEDVPTMHAMIFTMLSAQLIALVGKLRRSWYA
jgi:hypothetical protein